MVDMDFDFEAEIDTKDAVRKGSLRADGISVTPDSTANRNARTNTVCRHWLKNLCMRGDRCEYLHVFDPDRMPECNNWLRYGKCSDPDCVFKHISDNDRPECQRYKLGFCRFGLMCRSRHDRLPRDAVPNILPDWFINQLISNAYLLPKSDELPISELRDRRRGGRMCIPIPDPPATVPGTIPGLVPPIYGKCRYFVMRSMNDRNIQISAAKGIWATGPGNAEKLRQAFRDVDHIVLIFSATESRTFSGYAKMVREPDDTLLPGIWGEFSSRLSPNFRVHWLKQCNTAFGKADHIKNPQNDDLPVRRHRDGQELPSSVGERLCRFLWHEATADIVKGSEFEFGPRVSYDQPPPPPDKDVPPHLRGGDGAPPGGDQAGRGGAASGPLALEDRRDGGGGDDRARPAPARLGTFDPSRGRSGASKPLASGSSSLAAALQEEGPGGGYGGGGPAGGAWQPPFGPPGGHIPPPGYYPPGPPPGYYPPVGPPPGYEHYGGMPMYGAVHHPPPFREPPPGFFGAPPTNGGGFHEIGAGNGDLPPAGWQGASSAAPHTGRDRSRSRHHRRRRR